MTESIPRAWIAAATAVTLTLGAAVVASRAPNDPASAPSDGPQTPAASPASASPAPDDPSASATPTPSPTLAIPDLATDPVSRDVLVHVDGESGDDANVGAAQAPVATLRRAFEIVALVNRRGDDVRVLVAPGTYREHVELPQDERATDAAITIEGQDDGVVISGSDVVTNWTSVGGGAWSTPWQHNWGLSSVPSAWTNSYAGDQLAANPVIRRRELVFVDGDRLHQITSGNLQPGDFRVDEDANRLLIRPRDGADPANALVEIGMRERLLLATHRNNVTVTGIVFEHAASGVQGRAIQLANGHNLTLSDVVTRQNSWGGIGVFNASDVELREVIANHNGVSGLNAIRVDRLRVIDSETSNNGWRGARGTEAIDTSDVIDPTFVDFAGGQKFLNLVDASFVRHTANDNASAGLWFDFNNTNITITDARLTGNATWGLFIEASPGPVVVEGARICGNETGLLIGNSTDGRVANSTLANNRLSQVVTTGLPERTIQDRAGNNYSLATEDWSFAGNQYGAEADATMFATRLNDAAWGKFVDSFESSGARYLRETRTDVFSLVAGRRVGLAGWRTATSTDTDAAMVAQRASC